MCVCLFIYISIVYLWPYIDLLNFNLIRWVAEKDTVINFPTVRMKKRMAVWLKRREGDSWTSFHPILTILITSRPKKKKNDKEIIGTDKRKNIFLVKMQTCGCGHFNVLICRHGKMSSYCTTRSKFFHRILLFSLSWFFWPRLTIFSRDNISIRGGILRKNQ